MARDVLTPFTGTAAEPARHRPPAAPWRFVYEYQLRVYRRTWRGSLTTKVLTPVLFLLSMGVGLGSLVNSSTGGIEVGGQTVPYLLFVVPAILAVTCMSTGMGESSWPVLGAIKWFGTYHAMLATPARVVDILLGHCAYVVTMVGGTDHDRSQYNRAVQACRQPGSTYKPIYYSAALNEGYGFDTALNDVPRGEVDPVTGEIWIPKNLGGTVDFIVNMEYALVFSKNIPSVALFKKVGADNVKEWARKLGFTTEIIADKALALGASCTTLDELTRAFAIFARNGKWLDWIYVRRVFDRTGNLLEDNTVDYDPMLPAADRLDRVYATAGTVPRQAIPARAAFLTSKLLAQVITHGFSRVIRDVGIHAGGKTGTSSSTMDTTFVAYTSRWITTVWMGDDLRERPLGHSDAAYIVVEPMWARYMAQAAAGHPNREVPWEVPPGIDPKDRGDSKGPKKTMSLVYRERSGPPPPLQIGPPEG